MAYDTTKLVKLAALKALAEKVNSDYTKKTDFDALNEQVQGLVTARRRAQCSDQREGQRRRPGHR